MKIKGLLYLGEFPADPATLVNGNLWYNTASNLFKIRKGGVTKVLVDDVDLSLKQDIITKTLWDYWKEHTFHYVHAMSELLSTVIASGSLNAPTADYGYLQHGILIKSSASANSGYRYSQGGVANFFGSIAMKYRCGLQPKTSHTNRTIIAGFASGSNPTSEPVNGAYFWIVAGTVTPKCSQASTRTSASTYALTIDKPYIFDVEVNSAANSARFRIWAEQNETAVYDQTITSNIPTGLSQNVMPVVGCIHTGTSIENIITVYKLGFGTPNGYLRS